MAEETDSDEILIYDEQEDEHVTMHKIPVNDKDRSFLQCLFEADGYLTTSEIRQQTGINRRLLNYRYNKFGEERYSEIVDIAKVDEEDLPKNIEEMKKAKLTDKGRQLIRQGFIGDPAEDHISEEVVLTRDKYEELLDDMEQLENRVNTLKSVLDNQTSVLRDMQSSVDSLTQWRTKVNTFIIAMKSALSALNVDFGRHLKKAREKVNQKSD